MPYRKVIFAIDSYYTNLSAFLFYHMQQAENGAHLLFTVPCTPLQGIRSIPLWFQASSPSPKATWNGLDALQLAAGQAVNCNGAQKNQGNAPFVIERVFYS